MTQCRYWLAVQDGPMSIRLVDGCHDSPKGVAQAAKLHRRIFNARDEWVMVEIHALPKNHDVEINEEAAAICAHLIAEGTPNP